jgi:hypothetical protein
LDVVPAPGRGLGQPRGAAGRQVVLSLPFPAFQAALPGARESRTRGTP